MRACIAAHDVFDECALQRMQCTRLPQPLSTVMLI